MWIKSRKRRHIIDRGILVERTPVVSLERKRFGGKKACFEMLTLISDIFAVKMTAEIKGKASQPDLSMAAFVKVHAGFYCRAVEKKGASDLN